MPHVKQSMYTWKYRIDFLTSRSLAGLNTDASSYKWSNMVRRPGRGGLPRMILYGTAGLYGSFMQVAMHLAKQYRRHTSARASM